MAIHKVIEVLSESKKGWEDAAQKAVVDASRTVKNIRSLYVKEMTASVKDGEIVRYRINANITFELTE